MSVKVRASSTSSSIRCPLTNRKNCGANGGSIKSCPRLNGKSCAILPRNRCPRMDSVTESLFQQARSSLKSPSLARRLAAGAYDGLLLLALLFAAAFAFIVLFGSAVEPPRRYAFQAYLLAVVAAYFTWFWIHGGQTLAMKTWRLRLVTASGGAVAVKPALLRFLLAFAGLAFFGAGWWWALFDREVCFLHDRIAGTRLVLT